MIKNDIYTEYVNALKSKNKFIKEISSGLLASIKNKEIETKHELSDCEVVKVIQKELKQLKETMEFNIKSKRNDLIEECQTKIDFVNKFLPVEMTEDEVYKTVKNILSKDNISNKGLAMKAVMSELNGKANGKVIANAVDKFLNK